MAKIRVEGLYKIFGKNPKRAIPLLKEGRTKDEILDAIECTVAIDDASFEVRRGEIFVIMGLSGSGKSTVLRCLNRLIEPTTGQIFLDENHIDVVAADPEQLREYRREKMAMVFQHFGLLPHRTVSDNVSFGLEIQGIDQEARRTKAYETIEMVGLIGYEEMMTRELSGGMQQRVGLARALATDPEILLMDEAFSALDPLIRNNMQDELLDLQSEVHKTIIFITHDLDEALKLGERIAIMKDGKIEQIGTSEDILSDPASDYVEAFVENVDRSKVITASAIMFNNPERVVSTRDGPKLAVHRMRKLGISTLPVTAADKQFKGFVHITDTVRIMEESADSLQSVIDTDVPSTSPDTPVSNLLPLVWDSEIPIAVVSDSGTLLGLVLRPSVIAEITGEDVESQSNQSGKVQDD